MPVALAAVPVAMSAYAALPAGLAALSATGVAADIGASAGLQGMAGAMIASTPSWLPTAATALSVGGSALSAVGAYQTGQAQKSEMNLEAQQESQNANAAAAAGEANSKEAQMQEELAISSTMNNAAAGGGTQDPSVVGIIGNLETQGYMNQKNIIYNAQTQSTADQNKAIMDRFQGKQSADAGDISAVTNLFQGVTRSMYNKYNTSSVGF